jgi:radical SAM superfamily enzyme YgiQ (UPF0313 family)
MATIVSHALVAITASRIAYPDDRHHRIAAWAVALSILPDLDVLPTTDGSPSWPVPSALEVISLGGEFDDTFTVRRDRVFELCDEIKKRRLDFTWDVRAHVNTVTPELLRAMADAGCDRIHYGVESGNDRMMKVIKKNHSVEKVENAFRWTRAAGMETLAYFIIGQQTETASDIQDSIDLAKRLAPNYVHFTIFCPYPGTAIYQEGLDRGIVKRDVWREFSRNPAPGFELPVWEENFTRQELREMLVKCYKSFYLRPWYLLRGAARIRSLGEVKRKMKAGLSVFKMSPADRVFDESMARQVREVVPLAPIEVSG